MELCLFHASFACFYVSFDKTIIRISYRYRNLHSYFLHLDSTSIANRQNGSSKHDNMDTTTTANNAYISTTTQYTIYMHGELSTTDAIGPLCNCVRTHVKKLPTSRARIVRIFLTHHCHGNQLRRKRDTTQTVLPKMNSMADNILFPFHSCLNSTLARHHV